MRETHNEGEKQALDGIGRRSQDGLHARDHPRPVDAARSPRQAAVAALVGPTVEWYDVFIYATASFGYLGRPIGAAIFATSATRSAARRRRRRPPHHGRGDVRDRVQLLAGWFAVGGTHLLVPILLLAMLIAATNGAVPHRPVPGALGGLAIVCAVFVWRRPVVRPALVEGSRQ